MSEVDPQPSNEAARRKPTGRRLQFRLRTLLVLLSLLAIVSAVAGRRLYLRHRHQTAVAAIREMGGMVIDGSGKLAGGGDRVQRVYLSGITDDQLRQLASHLHFLPDLRELDIVEAEVSDTGLAELDALAQLERLFVYETEVTPDGLSRLSRSLPQLEIKQELPEPIATGLAMRPIYRHAVSAMRVSPTGRWLAAGDGRGKLWLWKLGAAGLPADAPRNIVAHTSWLFDVAFSSDGKLLATAGGDNQIVVWETATLRRVGQFTGHTDDVHAVAFARADRLLVSAGDDETIRVWDVADRRERHVLRGHGDAIVSLAVGPDGTTLASGSRDGDVRLWDLDSGQLIEVKEGHSGDVTAVMFGSVGQLIVSTSYDGTIRLWERAVDKPSRVLTGHTDWVFAMAFAGDHHLVSGGRDETLRLWDTETGRLIVSRGAQGITSRIAEVPGRDMLVTASAEGRIRFWDRSLTQCRRTLRLDFADPS